MKKQNLNSVKRRHTDFSNVKPVDRVQSDNSAAVEGSMYVESIFKELDRHAIEKIEQADAVVGCMAWLTNRGILEALSRVSEGVSIIVQKEDFLKPDVNHGDRQKQELRSLYSNLRAVFPSSECSFESRSELGHIDSEYLDLSIRCVGHAKKQGEFTMPRMHHKFLVFCKFDVNLESYWCLEPYAVWTGSFNMTYNGTQSSENAVYIENKDVAHSFFKEWLNILEISESLDWSSEYSEPDIQNNSLFVVSER